MTETGAMQSWNHFKTQFKNYVKTTSDLFTSFDINSLRYFELDYFLEKCDIMKEKPFSLTQYEMLLALSKFIDIQEQSCVIDFEIIPSQIVQFLRSLIQKNLLQLHPESLIKQKCLSL